MNETVELLQPEVKFGEQGYGVATKNGATFRPWSIR